MNLTPHQYEVYNQIIESLKTESVILLQGSAGTGKTFLVKTLVENLPVPNDRILISAPTHKALSVIREKVGNCEYKYNTVSSAMYMKRIIGKDGEIYFKPDFDPKYPPLNKISYFIIDEASMINKETLEYILEHAAKQMCKVILIGDNKQINPVNEEDSVVFTKGFTTFTLTEVVRQADGNPIIHLSNNLNLIPSYQESRNDLGGYVYTDNKDKIIETLASVNGKNSLKYLSWTNSDVDAVNKKVRQKVYGDNPAKIEIGETIVLNAPYGNYYTNQELLVEKLIIDIKKFYYGKEEEDFVELKYYNINYISYVDWGDSVPKIRDGVLVLHEDSEAKFKAVLNILKTKCKNKELNWTEYYNFAEKFADFKYNHALSIHKSQGSTYQQVIVNIGNIELNKNEKEKKRLLYTAITRASELVILFNV